MLGWESHAHVALVGEGLRFVVYWSQTAWPSESEEDNLRVVSCSPSFDLPELPPLCIATVCWARSWVISAPTCLWCLVQVAAVESVEAGKGLTGPELTWWNSVKGSPWLTDETVGLFLRLPGSRARRDLLCLASEDPDGSPTYHQASASWSAGGRPCRPAVPRCVVIVGKGPWSNEQRLRAVSSQAVRSGALSARHGAVLRYPWALGTCSPLVRVMFAMLHPTCAPAPTLSGLALSWPRCDLHCARA